MTVGRGMCLTVILPNKWHAIRLAAIVTAALAIQGCRSAVATEPLSRIAPVPEELRYWPRHSWRALLDWSDSCEEGFDRFDPRWSGVQVYPLPAKFVVEVACARGAYQGSQIYYYIDEDPRARRIEPIRFRDLRGTGRGCEPYHREGRHRTVGIPAELIVFNKFRGLGDCGSLSTYKLDGGRARLQSFKLKAVCDGKGIINGLDQWAKIKTYAEELESVLRSSVII